MKDGAEKDLKPILNRFRELNDHRVRILHGGG
jgi:hypothetical protein